MIQQLCAEEVFLEAAKEANAQLCFHCYIQSSLAQLMTKLSVHIMPYWTKVAIGSVMS
jgi:hypothetical protein